MNAAERLGLELRVCRQKVRYGRRTAMLVADRFRQAGEPVSAYRCPFSVSPDGHWHVGHGPSMLTLTRVAEVIRDRRTQPHRTESSALESTV